MVEEKIEGEELVKDRMLEAFLSVGFKPCTSTKYFSYMFKRINKIIRLTKGSKNIAEWDIEEDILTIYDNLSTSEKSVAKKFSKLPSLAEYFYLLEKKNGEQKQKNDNQSIQKIDKYTKAKEEIKQILSSLSDKEITKERLAEIINKIADNYVIDWHGDCSADHFNDNYYSYVLQTRSTIEAMMISSGDKRVSFILSKPCSKVYWDRYTDKQLSKMIKIVTLNAQREGNLFTITDKQHIVFEKNCEGAYKYVKEFVMKHSLRDLVPEETIEICWWENDKGENPFFIPSLQVEEVPRTYREVVLKRLEPKPKKTAKPSRLSVKIFFDENNKEGNILPLLRKWVSQPGIIGWSSKL